MCLFYYMYNWSFSMQYFHKARWQPVVMANMPFEPYIFEAKQSFLWANYNPVKVGDNCSASVLKYKMMPKNIKRNRKEKNITHCQTFIRSDLFWDFHLRFELLQTKKKDFVSPDQGWRVK